MTKYFFFDTETTGLIDFKAELGTPGLARVVQLACLLTEEDGTEIDQFCMISKPDGWGVMAPEAFAAHGITEERAAAEGVEIKQILRRYQELKDQCTDRVAYNISFDKRMLKHEEILADMVKSSDHLLQHDVMKMAKGICKLPPTDKMMASGRKTFKSPKLGEAYEFFTGKKLEGAHDAMKDVMAMKEIFFKIRSGDFSSDEKPKVVEKKTLGLAF